MCNLLFKQLCPFYNDEIPIATYNHNLYEENMHLRKILAENGLDYGWKKKSEKVNDKDQFGE